MFVRQDRCMFSLRQNVSSSPISRPAESLYGCECDRPDLAEFKWIHTCLAPMPGAVEVLDVADTVGSRGCCAKKMRNIKG
ncbi:hypothetical protein ElyMa_005279800 [Elysia marginata]|uniref:Uncharacterized protein n=1 Tax=Elysia marginata TaxID=1093978 RepID=A0AAV4JXL7_9GAST|nr:hypothetical protein ElyMa_005279800 [Elysia marginata]